MATFSNNLGAKGANNQLSIFYCEICDYKCCKKYSWERHLTTAKHTKSIDGNGLATKKEQKGQPFTCEHCCKQYKDRSGLWRHKKKCTIKIGSTTLIPDVI